ncbi:ABC transporter ATP-binding protein [Vibrio coralliilyticus]|nr:ABC transporter ATP-binding protein [Vibrio coralliilyticus]NOI50037.1 ABC transporter ATP-binding protein [Vibrio coralliilyticus]
MAQIRQPVKWLILLSVCLGGFGSLTTLVTYIGLAELGKRLLAPTIDVSAITQVSLWTSLALLIGWFCTGCALWISHVADNRLQASLRRALVKRLAIVPLGWYSKSNSGSVRKAVQDDLEDVHHLIAHHYVDLASAIVLPLGGIAVLLCADWRLALLATATLPVYGLCYGWMLKGFSSKMSLLDKSFAQVSAAIVEFVQGIEVVKIFDDGTRAQRRYLDAVTTFRHRYVSWVSPILRTEALSSLAISVPVIALTSLVGGSWMIKQQWISEMELLLELLIAMVIPQYLHVLNQCITQERRASAASERIAALLSLQPQLVPIEGKCPQDASIDVNGVSFGFDDHPYVLKDVCFHCAPGSVTALVGRSGSGKSTLAKLISRFYDVQKGAISIGGVDLRDMSPETLYQSVGLVLQDVQLLRISIRDNLKIAKPTATQQEIEAAAKLALIHDRIMALPKGYDSVIDEDTQLSGGEAQRLSIARTMLADNPILILDEATAHADAETEAELQSAVVAVSRGRTVIVIAHRLSSIKDVDQIVVLDNGCVVEQGSHCQLMANQKHYYHIWHSSVQHSAFNDEEQAF